MNIVNALRIINSLLLRGVVTRGGMTSSHATLGYFRENYKKVIKSGINRRVKDCKEKVDISMADID